MTNVERFRTAVRLLRDLILLPLVLWMPRQRHKVLFGAWSGRSFSCNPKYLFVYMCKRGGFDCIWVGDASLKDEVLRVPGARFVKKGTLMSLWHALTASTYACNVNWRDDIVDIPTCGSVHHLYLTHGYPDKKVGEFQLNGFGKAIGGSAGSSDSRKLSLRRRLGAAHSRFTTYLYNQKSWCSASSPQGVEIRLSNLPWRLSRERMMKAGTPRADYMLASGQDADLKQRLREKYASILGIPKEKTWYLFVPTWRHEEKYLFSFASSGSVEQYEGLLNSKEAVLIEKQHPIVLRSGKVKGGWHGSILIVDADQAKKVDTEELLVACDLLITDYSSIYYDFYLMNRPVVHFVYDYDHFMNVDMGFNYDLREYGGGPFAYTEEELIRFLSMSDSEILSLRNAKTAAQLSYETGHACEAYYQLIERLNAGRTI